MSYLGGQPLLQLLLHYKFMAFPFAPTLPFYHRLKREIFKISHQIHFLFSSLSPENLFAASQYLTVSSLLLSLAFLTKL